MQSSTWLPAINILSKKLRDSRDNYLDARRLIAMLASRETAWRDLRDE